MYIRHYKLTILPNYHVHQIQFLFLVPIQLIGQRVKLNTNEYTYNCNS